MDQFFFWQSLLSVFWRFALTKKERKPWNKEQYWILLFLLFCCFGNGSWSLETFAFLRAGNTLGWIFVTLLFSLFLYGIQSRWICFWVVPGRLFWFLSFRHSASFVWAFLLYQPTLSLSLYTIWVYRLLFLRKIIHGRNCTLRLHSTCIQSFSFLFARLTTLHRQCVCSVCE